ncbi:MAG: hypothetical protein HKN04_10220 [Rhodothermaceae bacterium]|nr:hypothetical protein [Rhodothermaceae bacterium]
MRSLLLLTLLILPLLAYAQPEMDETLEPFAFLVGQWAGPAWHMTPSGERQSIYQTEHVQPMLSGTILLIEGTGREDGPEGGIVFQALGILSYDEAMDQYYLDAFRDGRHIRAEVDPVEGGFDWGFEVEGRQIRYAMRLADGRWTENGHVTLPDGRALPIVGLDLERVSDEP